MTDPVIYEQRDDIVVLTLNAPESRNALGGEVLDGLLTSMRKANSDASCRAIVIYGGPDYFSSGGNLNNMAAERTLTVARDRVMLGGEISREIMAGPKPVIAAVEGYAAGAGFSLAVGSDYLVSSREGKYICAFAKVGLMPDMGMLWSLTQRIGLAKAKHLIASARKVTAKEGFDMGFVDVLTEPGASLDKAIEVAKEFASTAPLSFAMMKQAYARGMNSLEDALCYERDVQSSLYLTKDHREAIAAFLEKRAPVFKGE